MNKRDFLTALLLCLAGIAAVALFLLSEAEGEQMPVRPTLDYTDEQIQQLGYFDLVAVKDENTDLPCDIESWSTGDGFIHVVLPCNVSEDSVVVYIRDQNKTLLARRVYDFTRKVMIGSYEVLLEHHDLPALYFESDEPDDFIKMNEGLPREMICTGKLYTDAKENGRSFAAKGSLQGRGNISWERSDSKRSYSLRFDEAYSMPGLGKSRSWNLVGNAFDPSLLKNVVFNDISKQAGIKFQPKIGWVNLYVDGRYQGVYTLSDKIKAGKRRIPLGVGDYLFKLDPPTADQPVEFYSDVWLEGYEGRHRCDLIYPEEATGQQKEDAKGIIDRFVRAVEDHDYNELARICDINSLVRYYWIQECSMNFDACDRSVYMYYLKSDGRIHFGPVWDMDLTLGFSFDKDGMLFDSPEGWRVREFGWFAELFMIPEFAKAAEDIYYNDGIRDALFAGVYDFEEKRDEIGNDGRLNFLLFGYSNYGLTLDYGGDSYDEFCENLTRFYSDRINWIDSHM